jgi:hypothetical protein
MHRLKIKLKDFVLFVGMVSHTTDNGNPGHDVKLKKKCMVSSSIAFPYMCC